MNNEHDQAQVNTALVVAQFEAFALGDLPAVLGMLADDVDWQAPVSRAAVVALGRPSRGERGRGELVSGSC